MGIVFSKVEVFQHTDPRRIIDDTTFPEAISFPVRQIKTITFSDDAIRDGRAVGNHLHTKESGRWELFVALGDTDESLFRFRFRKPGGKVQERIMQAGDTCVIPPEHSHSFVPLRTGATILGISNQPYDSAHDVPDKLF